MRQKVSPLHIGRAFAVFARVYLAEIKGVHSLARALLESAWVEAVSRELSRWVIAQSSLPTMPRPVRWLRTAPRQVLC